MCLQVCNIDATILYITSHNQIIALKRYCFSKYSSSCVTYWRFKMRTFELLRFKYGCRLQWSERFLIGIALHYFKVSHKTAFIVFINCASNSENVMKVAQIDVYIIFSSSTHQLSINSNRNNHLTLCVLCFCSYFLHAKYEA